ncbi:MAG: deoxyribose-phosphate aldolase [Propionibacteriaceae bacterium]|jgi:deoxyribose-phosphate aldolase|nr:deoxyribose-phosphate aldolase [Propionibacteriaceae bacterium]
MNLTRSQLAGLMDHTLLKAYATPSDIAQTCQEAIDIKAASVCVNPVNVPQVAQALQGTGVKVCTVIGFPLGANATATKAYETRRAIADGAEEVDMVINLGALKAGQDETVQQDIAAVVEAAAGVLVKVIIETSYLTDDEKVRACQAAARAGADFVKTSTGFGGGGATAADVALMKRSIPAGMKVKASGGMRTWADVEPNLAAGADRLGLSASLAVLDGAGLPD